MKELIELYKHQKIDDLSFSYKCNDKFVESLNIPTNIGEDYFNKGEEFFFQDKNKAFEYYKISYKDDYWLAPYMLGLYFSYGLGDCIKSKSLAFDFFKEAINKEDSRAYPEIAELVDDDEQTLVLWKKFFEHKLTKDLEYKLTDFVNYNIDYRIIFLYKVQNIRKYEKEIREIIEIIKPTLIRDYGELIEKLDILLEQEPNNNEEEIFNDMKNILNLIVNSNEEEYFLSNEDMSMKLEQLIKRSSK